MIDPVRRGLRRRRPAGLITTADTSHRGFDTDARLALIGDRGKRLAVEQEFLMLCADFLLAVGGFPVGNPGNHLADIDRVLLRVMHERGSVFQVASATYCCIAVPGSGTDHVGAACRHVQSPQTD